MATKLRLIDITQLKKSSRLALQETNAVLQSAKKSIAQYDELMEQIGMDRKALLKYLNLSDWPAHYRKKATEDLLNWKKQIKNEMAQDVVEKRKQLKRAASLLDPSKNEKRKRTTTRKHRTSLI